jgi:serpin B
MSDRPWVRGFNRLGLDLFLRQEAGQNCLLSPLSISIALGMLLPGARGDTRADVARILGLDCNDEELGQMIRGLLATLRGHKMMKQILNEDTHEVTFEDVDAITLELANAVFPKEGFKVIEAARAFLKTNFEAELRALDYARPEAAAAHINEWVEGKTRNKIRDLLSPDLLSKDTRMVLVNALYFLAEWQDQFQESVTIPKPFHLSGGGATEVQMMRQTLDLGYFKDDRLGVEAVEIPYKTMSMVIVLPRKGAKIEALRPTLEDLERITGGLAHRLVALELPRFRIESKFRLATLLKELGMDLPFQETADFSGFTSDPAGLMIDEVIHKTFVSVDENGTEAAAATAIVMPTGAMPVEKPRTPIPFVVDRPCIFLIRDGHTGCVLFLGALCDPS